MRLLAALLAGALLLSACAVGSATESGAGFVQGSGVTDYAPQDREPAPAVVGETIDGERLALADLDGPVVVNFWASWCGPCIEEAPDLAAISERFADDGVHVVGVNIRDERVNAASFERDHGIPYPSWYDESAAIAHEFGAVGALPSTLILDAQHRVASRLFGAVTAAQLSIRLNALLDEVAADVQAPDEDAS